MKTLLAKSKRAATEKLCSTFIFGVHAEDGKSADGEIQRGLDKCSYLQVSVRQLVPVQIFQSAKHITSNCDDERLFHSPRELQTSHPF